MIHSKFSAIALIVGGVAAIHFHGRPAFAQVVAEVDGDERVVIEAAMNVLMARRAN
jgi:hypothetical protein